jgi:Tfp pilus assembly protein PilX
MAIYPMCGVCRQRGTVMLILNVMLLMAFLIMVAISLVEIQGSHHAGK